MLFKLSELLPVALLLCYCYCKDCVTVVAILSDFCNTVHIVGSSEKWKSCRLTVKGPRCRWPLTSALSVGPSVLLFTEHEWISSDVRMEYIQDKTSVFSIVKRRWQPPRVKKQTNKWIVLKMGLIILVTIIRFDMTYQWRAGRRRPASRFPNMSCGQVHLSTGARLISKYPFRSKILFQSFPTFQKIKFVLYFKIS